MDLRDFVTEIPEQGIYNIDKQNVGAGTKAGPCKKTEHL